MIVDIQVQGFAITQALTDHVWRRLSLILRRYSDRMQRVSVRVGDENGPRDGAAKFCRNQVHLIGAPGAVIDHVGADRYAAIDRAADCVSRVVVRNLGCIQPVRDAARRPEIQQPTHAHGAIE